MPWLRNPKYTPAETTKTTYPSIRPSVYVHKTLADDAPSFLAGGHPFVWTVGDSFREKLGTFPAVHNGSPTDYGKRTT